MLPYTLLSSLIWLAASTKIYDWLVFARSIIIQKHAMMQCIGLYMTIVSFLKANVTKLHILGNYT